MLVETNTAICVCASCLLSRVQEAGQVLLQPDNSSAASLHTPLPGVLVCTCSSAVPPERAGAWARGVFKEVQPQRVLVLGAMQVTVAG